MRDVSRDYGLDVFRFWFYANALWVRSAVDRVHQVSSKASDHAHRLKPVEAVILATDLYRIGLPTCGFQRLSLAEVDWTAPGDVPLQCVVRDGRCNGAADDSARSHVDVAACDSLCDAIG